MCRNGVRVYSAKAGAVSESKISDSVHLWRPGLPVSLLMVLHALLLECEKLMEFTGSSHCSCLFCPSRDNRDEAALSESVPTGAQVKE